MKFLPWSKVIFRGAPEILLVCPAGLRYNFSKPFKITGVAPGGNANARGVVPVPSGRGPVNVLNVSYMNKILALMVLTVVFAIPDLLWAESNDSKAAVQQLLGEIRQIKKEKNLSSQQEADNEKHAQSALVWLNVAEISKKALGKHWAKRSDPEQKKFQALLGELFLHVAFPSSAKFFAELELVYGKTKEEKQRTVVPLTVVHEKEGEVGIDFHLTRTADSWQVVDVILDGVSMRNNLRNKFYKVITKKGFDELIRKMEKKLH